MFFFLDSEFFKFISEPSLNNKSWLNEVWLGPPQATTTNDDADHWPIYASPGFDVLKYCCLVTSYGDMNVGYYWLR